MAYQARSFAKNVSWTKGVNILAGLVTLSVLVAGLIFVVAPSVNNPIPAPASTVTTTTKTTVNPAKSSTEHDVASNGVTTDKTTTEPQTVTSEVTTVDTPQSPSLLERYLTKTGLGFFALIGLVLLTAFLFGGTVQRVLLGHYEIKVGSLELPAITKAQKETEAGVEALALYTQQVADAVAHLPGIAAPHINPRLLNEANEHLEKARRALRDAGV